ncbi:hypothetical protein HMPREF1032_03448 [Subdoligranulum sp. 4_3_54A2FAA]|nr:hypothetical protein HMPREF1032_03448 [Subdoligranulum sp. 4_3_54A2FAA]
MLSCTILEMLLENQIDELVELCRKMPIEEQTVVLKQLEEKLATTTGACVRNTISLVLSKMHYNEAVNTIVQLINNAKNKNCRGTLVYALENLECQSYIKDLLYLLRDGNYETQYNTYRLLEKNIPKFSQAERGECLAKIESLFVGCTNPDTIEVLNDSKNLFYI